MTELATMVRERVAVWEVVCMVAVAIWAAAVAGVKAQGKAAT
jgi:hypothetical protein